MIQRRNWLLGAAFVAALIATPLLTILFYWFRPATDMWGHLASTVLSEYIINSLILMTGVGLLTAVLGTISAWLVSAYRFPGRKLLSFCLVLPLAFPTYIISFTYAGLLDYFGPVQTGLRALMNWQSVGDYWFPDIMNLPGAIVVMSLVLYPYVYLIVKPIFATNSQNLVEVAQTFGYSNWSCFWKVAFPLARPAIIAGASLTVMEALNDFGTVSYYGVPTFTTGIYRAWYALGDLESSARLAGVLVIFVFLVLSLERFSRRGMNLSTTTIERHKELPRISGWQGWLMAFFVALPFIFGFCIPITQLVVWGIKHFEYAIESEFVPLALRSSALAISSALLICAVALLLRFGLRLTKAWFMRASNSLATLGYAIPGSVISIGILIPLAALDNGIDDFLRHHFNISSGLILSGTVVALLFGYLVRFLVVGYNSIDAGLSRVPMALDNTAMSLGASPLGTLTHIISPLIRRSLLSASILIFIDIMKELPLTLILRPFNFDTLATRTYELATEEQLPESAPYALTIVALGILPVLLVSLFSDAQQKSEEK